MFIKRHICSGPSLSNSHQLEYCLDNNKEYCSIQVSTKIYSMLHLYLYLYLVLHHKYQHIKWTGKIQYNTSTLENIHYMQSQTQHIWEPSHSITKVCCQRWKTLNTFGRRFLGLLIFFAFGHSREFSIFQRSNKNITTTIILYCSLNFLGFLDLTTILIFYII